ncbi:sugar ABC transporter permease [Candidatus Aerophobetes bacterium]|nr:sugar ABC transporter permease [Candidatus Aerophobetes bacterium]
MIGKLSFLEARGRINVQFFMKILVLIVCAVAFEIFTSGVFLSPRNITLLLRQTAINGVLAAGMVFVIVSGNIDLSIGSGVALAGAVLAILQAWHGWSTASAVLLVMGLGLLMGIFNGFWVIKGVPAFVVTLGSMLLLRGLALIVTKGISIAPLNVSTKMIGQGFISRIPSMIILIAIFISYAILWVFKKNTKKKTPGRKQSLAGIVLPGIFVLGMIYVVYGYKGIPIPVVIMALVIIIMWFVGQHTVFGRYVYAIGGNAEASELSGINVKRTTFIVFVIMGVLTALGGILLSARIDGAMPTMGYFMELDAIAAAFIGGCSMTGGVGTVLGALFGALFMATLDNGMSLMNISSFIQYVVKGIIIILAVFSDISARGKG